MKRVRTTLSALAWAIFAVTPLPAAELMYVSLANNTIVTYDVSLSTSTAIAASSQVFANSNLNGNHALVFDTSGNLYAANYSNNDIAKFNPSGTFLSAIGSGNVNSPGGMAFDTSGNLYVANAGSNTISKFNSSGTFQSPVGSGNLSAPYGLAIDASGNLYAANFQNFTISKFDSAGNFAFSWSTAAQPQFLAFAPVPEPSTWIFGTIAAATFGYMARRRQRCQAAA